MASTSKGGVKCQVVSMVIHLQCTKGVFTLALLCLTGYLEVRVLSTAPGYKVLAPLKNEGSEQTMSHYIYLEMYVKF